jgi:DNA-3-methyladenine glycosylase II
MFLIFALGRLNILPVGELGIRTGVKCLYSLPSLPHPDTVRAIADRYQLVSICQLVYLEMYRQ